MAHIDTDHLVVGAGASGMAFVDSLVTHGDGDVVLVDRRARPGGHWNDAYPFVRLHQPSAVYGVASVPLGADRIDRHGVNAGFYERATGGEVRDYFWRVLDEHLEPTGRVRFLGLHDHLGTEGDVKVLRSRLTGELTTVGVRRRVVDAASLESSIPATCPPAYPVHPDARLVTPNQLADLAEPASGFTVIGGSKTAMDTVWWLLASGIDPDRVRWVRSRDVWTTERASIQPLDLVAGFATWVADHNEAGAEADDAEDFLRRLEDRGAVHRLHPDVEPDVFRGATLCEAERDGLRGVHDVVRKGRVVLLGRDRIELEHGSIPTDAGQVHVDCTAAGLAAPPRRPVFDGDRITLQWVQFGIIPFSTAMIGLVEATRHDDVEKNRLCPPTGLTPTGDARSFAACWADTQRAVGTWMAEPDLDRWLGRCRLNVLGRAGARLADPAVIEPLTRSMAAAEAAIANLDRIAAEPVGAART